MKFEINSNICYSKSIMTLRLVIPAVDISPVLAAKFRGLKIKCKINRYEC